MYDLMFHRIGLKNEDKLTIDLRIDSILEAHGFEFVGAGGFAGEHGRDYHYERSDSVVDVSGLLEELQNAIGGEYENFELEPSTWRD
ncbi:hypothetical protein Ab1vBOLIVR5_gp183 [Agrobacterium phage OLIVR5]|uniref:Uncharacterized protein n=2 Tax=Caudoviricetes TaxID=2731619 RepID=A0A858MTT4_9CAUD|nr:hypothetical protein KNU99_gp218 [Agrobacterium phage OLIVR5]QIW87831.1 hypothetical protein Ab1vBOLIVR5_gp183 [Agrobacterium phage OLIVR5]QIW88096.1 hypothetical protein Ab1vBOLIVR6_gp189 [Agrobacterium phage OLIVR6]